MVFKSKKSLAIVIITAILGVLLIVVGGINSQKEESSSEKIDYKSYTNELEKKLESFLLSIDGINKAEVIVTLENSSEQVYAQNQTTYDFLTITSDKGESPVYITEIYPIVRGVAISCTNGGDDEVKMKINRLISAYLGISSNRIEIVEIK